VTSRFLIYIFLLSLCFCTACKQERIEPTFEESFYYWRTVFTLDEQEKRVLNERKVKRLFVRIFDIDIVRDKAVPIAPIRWMDTTDIEIVPTIFIKNRVFNKIEKSDVEKLAKEVANRIESDRVKNPREIQIDCDWTKGTKNAYFHFLKTLQSTVGKQIKITSTLRLHQLKFPDIAGVPPVSRATLMVYNVGDFDDVQCKNSIIDFSTVLDYLGDEDKYPLALDFAFPIFDQMVAFRENNYFAFFRNEEIDQILRMKDVSLEDNMITITKDTMFGLTSLLKGDKIRYEVSDPKIIDQIINHIKFQSREKRNLIWFDLNRRNLHHMKNLDTNTIKNN
jgi:hypothetical protein